MGANGSGKSTLLGVVSGEHPQCYNNELELLDKKEIGIFSPEMAMHAPSRMSVLDVLLEHFPQPVLAEERKLAVDLLSDLGLGDELKKPLKNLSEEHKRLVLIARAISRNPKLLILDEPTQGMSSRAREALFAILDRISDKTTIIFATHYPGEWPKCVNNTLFLGLGTRD
jgi:molybdate transport system ATP-binding protein